MIIFFLHTYHYDIRLNKNLINFQGGVFNYNFRSLDINWFLNFNFNYRVFFKDYQ